MGFAGWVTWIGWSNRQHPWRMCVPISAIERRYTGSSEWPM